MRREAERIPLLRWRRSGEDTASPLGGRMDKKIYKLKSTSPKRVVESPFCLCGERIAAFYLKETALRMARMLREGEWCKTVYGCYSQPDGTFLIGPASALPVGKYRQTLALREVK